MNTTELESQVLTLAGDRSPLHRLIKTTVLEPQKEPSFITTERPSSGEDAVYSASTLYSISLKQKLIKSEEFNVETTEAEKQAIEQILVAQSAQEIVDLEINEFQHFATKSFPAADEIETIAHPNSQAILDRVWKSLLEDCAHLGTEEADSEKPRFPLMLSREAVANLAGKESPNCAFRWHLYLQMPRWNFVDGVWVRTPFYTQDDVCVVNRDYQTAEFEDAFVLSHRGMENSLPEGVKLVNVTERDSCLYAHLSAMLKPVIPQYMHVLRFRRCARA